MLQPMLSNVPRGDSSGTCSDLANLSPCPSSTAFCCPSSTTCIPLTSSYSTVICCPTGSDCTYIEPITCDISLQNATAYPYNTLHTTQLGATLLTCGSQCCPTGYECVSGVCAREKYTASAPSSTAAGAQSSVTGTGLVVPTNTAISVIVANATTILSDSSRSTSLYSPRAILIGAIVGLAIGILLTLLLLFLLRRHRRNAKLDKRKSASIFGGKTPRAVSGPFITPQQQNVTNRSDFLLRLDSQQASPAPLLRSAARVEVTPSPETPLSQMAIRYGRRGSGQPPLFQSPLRFGLPVSPLPPPKRPMSDDEQVVRTLVMETQPNRNGPTLPHRPPEPVADPRMPVARQNSDDSYISTGSAKSHKTSASSGTINVLMPPPVMIERKAENVRGVSTYTTMTMMLEGAGLRLGESSSSKMNRL